MLIVFYRLWIGISYSFFDLHYCFLIQNEFGYAVDEIAYFEKVIQPVLDGISLKIM